MCNLVHINHKIDFGLLKFIFLQDLLCLKNNQIGDIQ